jgi:DNA polymerase V
MIFHIDGNSFYASCERLFRPDLRGRPIVVLTNNDGVLISLTQEAKDLGFKRGDIFFQTKDRLNKAGVEIFSSNYTLYADMSRRLNLIYWRYALDVEFYSIDESFLYLPDTKNIDYCALGHEIKDAAACETGLPVSVGAAPTKTLAKMCNKLAKKHGGVCVWTEQDPDETLKKVPVEEVWGIGRAKAATLAHFGVRTALDLKHWPLDLAKKYLSITGLRTVEELNGIPAIPKTEEKARQQIMVSKSFSQAVFSLEQIETALTDYAQEALKRLRNGGELASMVTSFIMTNPMSSGAQYANGATVELLVATDYFPVILQAALEALRRVFRPGFRYRKAMILLSGLTKRQGRQTELFGDRKQDEKQERLMTAFDSINTRYGRGTIQLATSRQARAGLDGDGCKPFEMKRNYLSPCYTTRIADLPEVY